MQVDLTGFDVPERRLNTERKDNVAWLLRNLGIKNREHPRFEEVMAQLKQARRTAK